MKSITLVFEALDAKGARLYLTIIENAVGDLAKPGLGHWNGLLRLFSLACS
jgi:hypothetical protein